MRWQTVARWTVAGLAAATLLARNSTLTWPTNEAVSRQIIPTPFPFPPSQSTSSAASESASRPAPLTRELANPIERAPSLRLVYDLLAHRGSAAQRALVDQAWSACFPALLAPQDNAPTLAGSTAALPNAPNRAARVEAYRMLMARCNGFLDLSREHLVAETRSVDNARKNGIAASPGDQARHRLQAGDRAGALAQARAVIESGDAYAIGSLRDFMFDRLSESLQSQGVDTALPRHELPQHALRADLRALAFALAACQLGLDCSPGALTALRQCAYDGACDGNVAERMLQPLSPDERTAVEQEARRVLTAIAMRDYDALGLMP